MDLLLRVDRLRLSYWFYGQSLKVFGIRDIYKVFFSEKHEFSDILYGTHAHCSPSVKT